MAVLKADAGSLWLQQRPGAELVYGGDCIGVGDISQDLGDITVFTCRDRTRNNRRRVVASEQGAPGAVTTSLEVPIASTRNAIMAALEKCPSVLYVNKWTGTGAVDDFANRSLTVALVGARPTSRGMSNVLSRDESADRTMLTADISAEDYVIFYDLEMTRLTSAATAALHWVVANTDQECESEEETYLAIGQNVLVGGAAPGSGVAEIAYSDDEGGTFTAVADDPFAADENANKGTSFNYGGGTRYMAARTTADAGAPAEIAYTDDAGATWTNVNVGSTNGQFVTALWAYDSASVWAGTNDGYIYRSVDGGATWSTINAAVIASADWLDIDGVSRDVIWFVGESDVVAYTNNGSAASPTLTAATATGSASNLVAVDVHTRNRVWVATAGGDAYLTTDGGTTWTAKFTSTGVATAIAFDSTGLSGYLLVNSGGSGSVYHTRNGGANWEAIEDVPTNAGLNGIYVLDTLEAYVVGAVQGGTAFIGRIAPVEDVA